MMSKKERAKPGERQEAVMDFLRKEMVGDSLLFTAETAARAVESTGVKDVTIVYGILQSLEKKGKKGRLDGKRPKDPDDTATGEEGEDEVLLAGGEEGEGEELLEEPEPEDEEEEAQA